MLLQEQLAQRVAALLAPGGYVFLQSNVEIVAQAMRRIFQRHLDAARQTPNKRSTLAEVQPVRNGVSGPAVSEGLPQQQWLDPNPFGAMTETEAACFMSGRRRFRTMLCNC
jgi:hypothetical protein